MERLHKAAQIISAARHAGSRLAPLPADIRPRDEAEAYSVQRLVDAELRELHGPQIGFKIGCTTAVMQDYLGIPNPCYAVLRAGDVAASGSRLDHTAYSRLGVECEIAVRLGARLSADDAADRNKVLGAIDAVHAAIEIVDDRYVDWRTLDTPTLIADDFFSAGAVLGPAVAPEAIVDLAEVKGETRINGALVGAGRGSDVMGHPVAALAWLADKLQATGGALEAGQIVLTGSLVETRWLAPGDTAEIAIAGLGKLSLTVASD
ncbi:MAG: 2-keto-4-pentenoate hydratase [Alphaproteobacteria bacterium]